MLGKWNRVAGRVIDEWVLPLTPKRHRLALRFFRHVRLTAWEPETLHIRRFARPGCAVDVGANMGLWSYAMARAGVFSKIVALEPNIALTHDLQGARIPEVEVRDVAASDVAGQRDLKIPVHRQMVLSGWASLESNIDVATDEFQVLPVKLVRIDDLDLSDVSFVKMDVEGHELSALQGATRTIGNGRPACLIECRDRNLDAVRAFFQSLNVGYVEVDTQYVYGFSLSPGNHLFQVA